MIALFCCQIRGNSYLVPTKVEHVYVYELFLFLFFFSLSAYLHGAAKRAASAGRHPEAAKRESSERVQNKWGWSFDQTSHRIKWEKSTEGWNPLRWQGLSSPPQWSRMSNYILQQSGSTLWSEGRKSKTSVKSVGDPQTNLRLAVKIFGADKLISLLCIWGMHISKNKMEVFPMQKHQTNFFFTRTGEQIKGNVDGLSNPNFWLKIYFEISFSPWAILAIDFFF